MKTKNKGMSYHKKFKAIKKIIDNIEVTEAKGSLNNINVTCKYKKEDFSFTLKNQEVNTSLNPKKSLFNEIRKIDSDYTAVLQAILVYIYMSLCEEIIPSIKHRDDYRNVRINLRVC
ncbi:hypothetical protein [Billgrantia endophytica]|uniref:hypothetical protein n=1 Tax=Billgrantia endophytica TaxID=2033802 RepID=UPI001055755A|nr:hypothetical protein [Halomonas endophytica]